LHSRQKARSCISLHRDEALKEGGQRLPKSTRTIHRILQENGRIAFRLPTVTEPIERPSPMQHWQLDAHRTPRRCLLIRMAKSNMWEKPFISSIRAPQSWWLTMSAPTRRAETALAAVAQTFSEI